MRFLRSIIAFLVGCALYTIVLLTAFDYKRQYTSLDRNSTSEFLEKMFFVPFIMNAEQGWSSVPGIVLSSSRTKRQGHLYVCGFDQGRLANYLFDDYIDDGDASTNKKHATTDSVRTLTRTANTTSNDVLFFGMGGPCDNGTNQYWVHEHFPGKAVFSNGEAFGDATGEGTYMISSQPTSSQNLQVSFMAVTFVGMIPESTWPMLTWKDSPRRHLNNTGKKLAIYVASHCVHYRQATAALLSTIGTVHHGKCRPSTMELAVTATTNKSSIMHLQKVNDTKVYNWAENYKVFQNYRYCLVMENRKLPGYMTEKILMAFLGGCIPIWYGTEELLNIFNIDSFLFWNVTDPSANNIMMARILRMEANESAYNEVLHAPVLANGNTTLENYFSFADRIGSGKLKHKLRVMMGVDEERRDEVVDKAVVVPS